MEGNKRYYFRWNSLASFTRASCRLSCWLIWRNVSSILFGNCLYSSVKETPGLHQRSKCDDICFYRHCRCLWIFLYEDDFWPTRIPAAKGFAHRHGRRIFEYSYTHHNSSSRNIPSNIFVYFDLRRRYVAMFLHGLACGGFSIFTFQIYTSAFSKLNSRGSNRGRNSCHNSSPALDQFHNQHLHLCLFFNPDVYFNNWLHTHCLIISCSRAYEDRFLPSAEPDFKRWQQKRRRWTC